MRIALVSDIHGNLEAFQAVLSDIESKKLDKVFCLGDVIGYGCDPVACMELVDKHCHVKLVGNHEYLILGLTDSENYNPTALESFRWTRERLGERELKLIEQYEIDYVLDHVYLVHASPCEPTDWNYILNPQQAAQAFDDLKQQVCFSGHSHLPMIFTESHDGMPRMRTGHDITIDVDERYLINIGSVGQPRDNDPRASYVSYDFETHDIVFERVDYDYQLTQKKMAEACLPQMLIERLAIGR